MLRHARVEKKQRAQQHGEESARSETWLFSPQRGNDSREISFHVSLPCLQTRIRGVTSRTSQKKKEEKKRDSWSPSRFSSRLRKQVQGVNRMESREEDRGKGVWPRVTAQGQMLTARASSSANGLLIEAATRPRSHLAKTVSVGAGGQEGGRRDWITGAEKQLFFPLNPAAPGPKTVHRRFGRGERTELQKLKVQCVEFGLIYDFYTEKSLTCCPEMH